MMILRYLFLLNLALWLVHPVGAAELLVDLGYREEAGRGTAEDRSPRKARIVQMIAADSQVSRQGEFSALSFPNAGDQYIEIKERFAFENGFSIAVWIRPANSKGWMEVVSCGLDSKQGGIRLRWGARGLLNVFLGNATGALNAPANSAPAGVWTHVVVASDGVVARLFINGAEIASTGCEGLPVEQPRSLPVVVGNYAGRKDAYPFRGEIGPVKIYDGALSVQEIQAFAAEQSSPFASENE